MLNVKSNNIKERAYFFALDIVKLVRGFPQNKTYMIFTDQLLRSATSVGANLIEAKSSSSKKDFIKFYQIALKSCNESLYWLCLLRDSQMIDHGVITGYIKENKELGNMLGSSVLTLKGKKDKRF